MPIMQLRQMMVGGAGEPRRPESRRSRGGGGHDAVVAKDAVLYSGPVVVSLWSGDEGNEAQPKHSTWDKSCSVSVCTRSSLQSESWLLPPLPIPFCLTPSSAPRRTGLLGQPVRAAEHWSAASRLRQRRRRRRWYKRTAHTWAAGRGTNHNKIEILTAHVSRQDAGVVC